MSVPRIKQNPNYKPSRGTSGPAKFTWGENKILIEFEGDNDGERLKIARTEFPEYVPENLERAFVTLTAENDEIMGVRPIKGVFSGKVDHFAVLNEDTPPAPREYTGKSKQGGTYTYLAFTVLIEIKRGPWKGAIVPYFLHYKFTEGDDGSPWVYGTGLRSDQLANFLESTGAYEGKPMEFEDNILPELEKRILKQARMMTISMQDGYVNNLMPAEDATDEEGKHKIDEEDEADEEKETKKSKTATSKGKSKKDTDEDDDL